MGDSQDNPDIFGKLVGLMKDSESDIAVGVGDLLSSGWDLVEWEKKYFSLMKDFNIRIPMFSGIGNHEVEHLSFTYTFHSPPMTIGSHSHTAKALS